MIKMFTKKRNKKGFTLVELIVVIAILGILAAIAIPRLGGFTESAKKANDETVAATLATAGALYYAQKNAAPADVAALFAADLTNYADAAAAIADIKSTAYSGATGVTFAVASNKVTVSFTGTTLTATK